MKRILLTTMTLGLLALVLPSLFHPTGANELSMGTWVASVAPTDPCPGNLTCAEWVTTEYGVHLRCCILVQDLGSSDPEACLFPIGLGGTDPLRDDT